MLRQECDIVNRRNIQTNCTVVFSIT